MIVSRDRLGELAGRVTMVAGGFDPIHPGHVAYFRAARAFGNEVLCAVSPDTWVERKHRPLLPHGDRVLVLDAFRDIDYAYAAAEETHDVLELVRPRVFAKGADWRGRLPEIEWDVCERYGIEVVFLDTVTHSSSAILDGYLGS